MEQMNGKISLNGGAIALGQPLGCSGAYQHHAYQPDGAQRRTVWSGDDIVLVWVRASPRCLSGFNQDSYPLNNSRIAAQRQLSESPGT